MLQAVDLLVERYRRLKQSGATSVEKNSYLTKVHELEGMIQLSEAIPGANCTVEIFSHPGQAKLYQFQRCKYVDVDGAATDVAKAANSNLANGATNKSLTTIASSILHQNGSGIGSSSSAFKPSDSMNSLVDAVAGSIEPSATNNAFTLSV
ncbi:MCM DNA helicase complex subunit mcm6 [Ceratobasidium sp. 395]|nr:MCM DNA helicase complex subunit mcm6 [Ceratobasidium sp. 395]